MKQRTLWMVGLVALLASACGGGNDSTPVAATDAVPDAVSQSAAGMTSWLSALSRDLTEAKEPLDVARFTPPTSEVSEPEALQ